MYVPTANYAQFIFETLDINYEKEKKMRVSIVTIILALVISANTGTIISSIT